MAKLDDFGRPIYETAEEYNQAHRGCVCPRSYDSPDGANYQKKQTVAQRHATVQGSKSAMKKVLAILGVILSINVGAIFSLLGNLADDIEVGHVEEEVQVYDEYLNQGDTPLVEGYEKFFYNGEYYSIPTNYWKISQMGFETVVYDADELIPAGYEEIIAFVLGSYYFSLENIDKIGDYPFYGSFKMINNLPSANKTNKHKWFYVGTFFWGDYQRIYGEHKHT